MTDVVCANPACGHVGTLHVEGKCEDVGADGALCGCPAVVS